MPMHMQYALVGAHTHIMCGIQRQVCGIGKQHVVVVGEAVKRRRPELGCLCDAIRPLLWAGDLEYLRALESIGVVRRIDAHDESTAGNE